MCKKQGNKITTAKRKKKENEQIFEGPTITE